MTRCARPGCGGEIDEEGFCDTCGLAVAVSAPAVTPPLSTRSTSTGALTSWSTPTSGTSASRSTHGSTRSRGRDLLGEGIVEIASLPRRDPREAVLADPSVPESKRFCSSCGAKVGRGREDRPGRTEGFCPQCGHQFSFVPKLAEGEVVQGQYEVLGCLAHGGLGWIYLALDHAVADRWVVLKGLLDSGDADAMAAAVAETRFLAQVEHPAIVRIFNFVEHRGTGYIVMEYVGGTSIKDLIKQRRQEGDPSACLPLTQAIAYTLKVLPALGHLHESGLVYCDFKPDNAIHGGDRLKLIDLGAVRRVDDQVSPIYGTVGYQAPEIGKELPSPASDLYTVGRSLAVMTFPFDFHNDFPTTLPSADSVPLLAEHESFHRLLLRATHRDPALRFASAAQMREQLEGVFREVAAAEDGEPRPGPSAEFTPERRSFGVSGTLSAAEVAAALPVSKVDADDPGTVFLAGISVTDPEALIAQLVAAPAEGVEVGLRLARARIELGDVVGARAALDGIETDPGDWRVEWHRGLAALAADDPGQARASFEAVYDLVPGESAPKLAIAACAELTGDTAVADRCYRLVWRTDRSFISAAFGLARVVGRAEAVDVLESVPDTSSHHLVAQLAAIRSRLAVGRSDGLSEVDLVLVGNRLSALELDDVRRVNAERELLEAAYEWSRAGDGATTGTVLGRRLVTDDLRRGMEGCYLALARQASTRLDRIAWVDRANQIRPRTWF
ncbi:tetratricopeptide repeat protein [Kutzneria sp. NPDC052558]|uniref:serine/threonine-protein kinase n=1 Tax=Kutzneria sp. NPDC052558 TaxID=3364121 RepID=UPI0037CC89AD